VDTSFRGVTSLELSSPRALLAGTLQVKDCSVQFFVTESRRVGELVADPPPASQALKAERMRNVRHDALPFFFL
jgi:hypothetical protein